MTNIQPVVSRQKTTTVSGRETYNSGLVLKYEARPKPNPNLVSKECAKSRARTFRSSTEIYFGLRFRFFAKPEKSHTYTNNLILKPTVQYRYKLLPRSGREQSFTCLTAERSGSFVWCDGKHSGAHCCK